VRILWLLIRQNLQFCFYGHPLMSHQYKDSEAYQTYLLKFITSTSVPAIILYACPNVYFWNLLFQGGGTPIYPVLWSSSSVKVKVKSQGRILEGQRSSIDFSTVLHNRYFYRQLCEQKFTRNRTRVKHNFQQKSKVKANLGWPCTLTEDGDRSAANIGVPPPCCLDV